MLSAMSADSPQPSIEWWNDQLPPKRRAIGHIGTAVSMVRDLPLLAHLETEQPTVIRIACLEAFFVNVRLIADFLWKMPPRDVNARTYLPDWSPPKADAKRMKAYWHDASSL